MRIKRRDKTDEQLTLEDELHSVLTLRLVRAYEMINRPYPQGKRHSLECDYLNMKGRCNCF